MELAEFGHLARAHVRVAFTEALALELARALHISTISSLPLRQCRLFRCYSFGGIAEVRYPRVDDDLKQLLEAMRQENAMAHAETRRHSEQIAVETRRHFDVALERIEKRFGLLAETVQHVNEELGHTRASLHEKIDRTAAETQSMIKFSPPGSIAASPLSKRDSERSPTP